MSVPQISPREARQLAEHGAALVDVREVHEHAQGMAEGAMAIPRAEIERDPPFSDAGFHVSRDGGTILYSQVDQSGSDILLVERFR